MKVDKAIYDGLKEFGVIFPVKADKTPKVKWKNLSASKGYDEISKAIIPNKNKKSKYNLLIIDVDTKKSGKGLESLEKLTSNFIFGDLPPVTVKTPSGGYHYYIFTTRDEIFQFNRYNPALPDLEFIAKNGYVLLPTNKGIITTNEKGEKIRGTYELLDKDFLNLTDDKIEDMDYLIEDIDNSIFLISDDYLKNEGYDEDLDLEAYEEELKEEEEQEEIEVEEEVREFENQMSLEEKITKVEKLLPYLDNEDYHSWVTNGGRIKKALGEDGLKYFIEWSLKADNATTKDELKKKWAVLPSDVGNGIGAMYIDAVEVKKAELLSKLENVETPKELFNKENYKEFREYPYIKKEVFEKDFKKHIYKIHKKFKNKGISDKAFKKLTNSIYDRDYFEKINDSYDDDYINKAISRAKFIDIYTSYIELSKGEFVENPIKFQEQKKLIKEVVSNAFKVSDSKITFIDEDDNLTSVSLSTSEINRSFKQSIKSLFPQVVFKKGDTDREELEGHCKISMAKLRNYFMSLYHEWDIDIKEKTHTPLKKNGLHIDYDNQTVTQNKFDPIPITNHSKEVKKLIIDEYKNYWHGDIYNMTRFLMLGKYVTDTKMMNLVLLANSNKGKNFHFDTFHNFDIGKKVNLNDFTKNGRQTNNITPTQVNGYWVVFDESANPRRAYFEISNSVTIRPLYKSAVEVKIGGRLFLNADGGIFNKQALDNQYKNRFIVMDYRKFDKTTIDDLVKTINKNHRLDITNDDLQLIVQEYNLEFIKAIHKEYENMTLFERIRELKRVKKELAKSKAYRDLSATPDYTEQIGEELATFFSNPEIIRHNTRLMDEVSNSIFTNKNTIVFRNATKYFLNLINELNSQLSDEIQYKNVMQLVDNISWLSYKKVKIDKSLILGIAVSKSTLEEKGIDYRRLESLKEL